MTVDKKGKYSYTFKDGVAEYYLKVGNWVTPVFSKDNDKLSADIVVADKTVDVKFKGSHAAENNYLCMLTTLQNYPSATDPGSYQAVAAEKIADIDYEYNYGLMRDVDIMKAMKNCLGGDLANQYSTRLIKWKLGGKRLKEMEHLYNTYTDICSDDNLVKTTEQTYKSYMASISVGNGAEAPDCKMYDVNGTATTLRAMRGKMVVIDVWTTWCGPCKREMPYFANLYNKFRGSDKIEFISISVDANKTAWKNMVEKDNHEWKQYIVTDEADSDFSKKFGIDMIPRFIVIDKNGIVRDINFMRPSSPNSFEELKKMLETYS